MGKEMLLVARSKERCCGCYACSLICPHAAITMAEDEDGFMYAIKNEKCTGCGICMSVCPFSDEKR